MRDGKRGVVGLALVLLLVANPARMAATPVVKEVIYITLSKACGCLLEKCQAGDEIVRQVFVGPRQAMLKRFDYVTQREAARIYIRQYRITIPPALLFLDDQGQELWRTMGELDAEEIRGKLEEFGG